MDELSIKDGGDGKSEDRIVMRRDFLLTVDMGEGVFEVGGRMKMKEELVKERVLEKFALE
ncbi:hypothetical protein [Bacillus pumilus]|uniref:hypothetical protein n=1 Tax=Bacillus pumilus TaxID=1408 RepID=UPI0011A16FE8|nr:hypothetical protein [Bacillus pumilus]